MLGTLIGLLIITLLVFLVNAVAARFLFGP